MRNTKHQLIPFSVYDLTGMEQHLEKMAQKGWLLDKISALGWRYRRIEPQKLHFTVSYCYRASAYDPEPTEEVQTFHDFCAHTGWHLAAEFGSMQVFYNDQEDPTPIDTDPSLEIQMVGREVKRMLPAQILLLLLGLWMGGSWCYSLIYKPIDLLASPTNLFTGACWLGLLVWSVADILTYLLWRRRAKKAAERGEFVPTHGCHRIMQVVMALVVLGVIYYFVAARLPGLRILTAIMILGFAALFLAVNGTKDFLKKRKVSRRKNQAATIAVDVLLAVVLMAGISYATITLARNGDFSLEADIEPPLTIADLTGEEDSRYVVRSHVEASVFLKVREFIERSHPEESVRLPELRTRIVDVYLPGVYDFCLRELLHERDDWEGFSDDGTVITPYYVYQEIDAAPFGAQVAWQRYAGGENGDPTGDYLLSYPGRLVTLECDWKLTAEEMAIVGTKLAPEAA